MGQFEFDLLNAKLTREKKALNAQLADDLRLLEQKFRKSAEEAENEHRRRMIDILRDESLSKQEREARMQESNLLRDVQVQNARKVIEKEVEEKRSEFKVKILDVEQRKDAIGEQYAAIMRETMREKADYVRELALRVCELRERLESLENGQKNGN